MNIRRKLIIAFLIPTTVIGLFSMGGFIWGKKLFTEAASVGAAKVNTELQIGEVNNTMSRYSKDYALLYQPSDITNFDLAYQEQLELIEKLKNFPLSKEEEQYVASLEDITRVNAESQKQVFKIVDEVAADIKQEQLIWIENLLPLISRWMQTLKNVDQDSVNKREILEQMQLNAANRIIMSKYELTLNVDQAQITSKLKSQATELINALDKQNLDPQERVWANDIKEYMIKLFTVADLNHTRDLTLNKFLIEDEARSAQISDLIDNKLYKIAHHKELSIEATVKNLNNALIISMLVLLGLGFILSIFFADLLVRPIGHLKETITKLRAGEVVEVKRQSNDEIGDLSEAFGDVVQDYSTHTVEINAQNWLKEHIANVLKNAQAESSLETMCSVVIGQISELLNAGCGAFYITKGDDESGRLLTLLGTYGYKKRKNLSSNFKFGEGIVGQAALEGKFIILSEIPEDYIHITSGLGNKQPNFIIVIPVKLETRTLGVMEFALFNKITDIQQQFLEQLSANIGVVIEAIQNRQKAEVALVHLQESSEELQTQQEELRASNEELEEKTHILQQSEEELKTQSEEMQASNEELEEKMRAIEIQKQEIQTKNQELETIKRELELKADDLTRAGQYKTEFLANMSHELRTPLNSLLLLSNSFAKNEDGNLTADQIEQANIIYKGGKDLLTLINDILDLSKVEAGKLNIYVEDTSINDMLLDLKSQFESVITNKKLQFIIDSSVKFDILKTDAQRVKQIIRNLLANAVKFTSTGSITLKITSSKDSNYPAAGRAFPGDYVAFQVIDTGIGIEKQKFNDIFEAFQQAYGDTDRTYGGTGLGLTISRKLAKLLGGEIILESEIGKGSTFSLFIPLVPGINTTSTSNDNVAPAKVDETPQQTTSRKIVSPKPTSSPSQPIIGDKKILIIEKDPTFIEKLKQITTKKGYRCISATDHNTAAVLAFRERPDAIILDLNEEGNKDFLARLNANEHTRNIPVHIITTTDTKYATNNGSEIKVFNKTPQSADLDDLFVFFHKDIGAIDLPILLIEDEIITQQAVVRAARAKNMDIVAVSTGKDGINKIKNENFSGIILDLNLPDISGLEILSTVSKDGKSLPPIIIYSQKDLSDEEYKKLNQYTNKIVLKEGDISLDRLLNECSLFLHAVDRNNVHKQNALATPAPDSILRDKEVLLVDDDMRNVYALSMVLKRNGLRVTVATNGTEALTKLDEAEKMDIVIMDIMMPVLDGYETTRRIRKGTGKYKNIPIIAVTAKAMQDDKKACMEAGANEYITKPIDQDKLLAMMRIWLSSTRKT